MAKCDRLTPDQRDSLAATEALLRAQEAEKVFRVPGDGLFLFNMNIVSRDLIDYGGGKQCGTVGCILGLAREIEKVRGREDIWKYTDDFRDDPTRSLFFPSWCLESKYQAVTPLKAADAINRFLGGDDRPWD